MEVPSKNPIYSLLVDEQLLGQLDGFVIELGERIDWIQDAEQLGHLEEVAKRASELAAKALTMGLPPLAEAAERVAECSRCGDGPGTHAEIVELTHVVTRVRLGHRGGFP